MNKFVKISMIIIGIIILLILLLIIISFVNHKIKLKKEDKLFKTTGKIVGVNNHNINVYVSGNSNSDTTLVFMSGAGTGYAKEEWRKFIIDYINSKKNGEYKLLDCSHYVHNIEYQKIYEESVKFIEKIK